MTWVRLDDRFPEHPKIAQLDDHALALFVTGLAYCNRNLTDGYIPVRVGFGQLRDCDGNPVPAIRQLEAVGLWEATEGGWWVHDYEDYQPTRADIQREQEAATRRRLNGYRSVGRGADGRFRPPPNPQVTPWVDRARSAPVPEPGLDLSQDKPSAAPEIEDPAGQALDEQIADPDVRFLLACLATRSRSWAAMVERPTELAVVRELAASHRPLVLSALRQAVDKTDQRKPTGWLRRVVEATAAHEREGVG